MTSAEPIIDTGDMPEVTLYTTAGCPSCAAAQAALQSLRLSANVVRLDRCLPAFIDEVLRRAEGRAAAAPLVFLGGRCIGGADSLRLATLDQLQKEHAAAPDGLRPPLPGPADIDPAAADLADDILDRLLPCELDEAAAALEAMRRDSDVAAADNADAAAFGTHWRCFWRYPRTFTGAGFARWAAQQHGWSAERIRRIGDLLLSGGLCRRVYGNGDGDGDGLAVENADALYRPLDADWLGSGALNADAADWRCRPPDSLSTIGEQLRCLMLEIQGLCISQDGRSVDYGKLAESEQFAAYRLLARRLQRVNPEAGSPAERLAFFINVYNALVLHAKLARGPPTSLWSRYRFFADSAYIIGGQSYSLLDIEHGVLRANRRGPGLLRAPFGRSDPRRRAVPLDRPEPLIHFALNCGARGCQPIRAYRAAGLRDQLLMAGRAYLSGDDAVRVSEDGRSLALSALFRWYSADFADSAGGSIAAWVAEHLPPGGKREAVEAALRATGGRPRISYLPYDWSHNHS